MSSDPSQHDPAESTTASVKALGIGAATVIEASLGHAAGTRIGPYVLLSILGEGGFGVVYLAERREPMVQRVALKIIKPGMDSKAVVARFEQERQALAVMDHPHVAKVFDGGVTGPELGSRPYFVMEHVQGEPITTYCDRQRLTTRQRLELFVPLCEAVQHAHTKGVIHRDLKPSNVLVAPGNPSHPGAVPKVIDFGVAKAVSQALTDKTIFTDHGQIVGTPEYMSPEQAEMNPTGIDTRSDVYSLGVMLYELLSGALPFDPATLRAAGYVQIQQMIREVEPPRPSTRLTAMGAHAATVAANRRSEAWAISRELRRELEWIPLKAMRKDREERYRTALELSDDIQRYLAGHALVAGPMSITYRSRKFWKRNKFRVAGVGMLGAALLSAAAYTVMVRTQAKFDAQWRRREQEIELEHSAATHIRAQQFRDSAISTFAPGDGISDTDADSVVKQLLLKADRLEKRMAKMGAPETTGREGEYLRNAVLLTDADELAICGELLLAHRLPARAEPLLAAALPIHQRLDQEAMLKTEQMLARCLLETERAKDAEPLLVDALGRMRIPSRGVDDPRIARVLGDLALARHVQGSPAANTDLAEAMDMHGRLSVGSQDFARALWISGRCKMATDRAAARVDLERAIAMMKKCAPERQNEITRYEGTLRDCSSSPQQ